MAFDNKRRIECKDSCALEAGTSDCASVDAPSLFIELVEFLLVELLKGSFKRSIDVRIIT